MARLCRLSWLAPLVWPLVVSAQTSPEIAGILQRLDRLEQENRALTDEVRSLRAELAAARGPAASAPAEAAAPKASVDERLEIQEQRTAELAQTKVEASERFPIRLTGMALFNSFLDSRQNGGRDYPTVASAPGPGRAGATLHQTIVGLDYRGPVTLWGGAVHGSVYMDFFTGSTAFDQYIRLRTGSLQIDWKTRSIVAGIEKPIFNPREPSSLAQVGVSPLTGTGNLWLWIPQVRFEQDFSVGPSNGMRAQVGVVQTREVSPYDASAPPGGVAPSRPGLEGRFEVFHKFDDERRLEIAPGFHFSSTHANGFSIPSNLFSVDWFLNPWQKLEFTGAFYSGQNVANLGTGGINQGYAVYNRFAYAVTSRGGWGQFTVHTVKRLDLHLFTGQMDDNNTRLGTGGIGKNLMVGVNFFYRLAPNVVLAPEISQLRTVYIGQGTRINNHYDLALAYYF